MTLVDLLCLTKESHWQHCERLPQETASMCVSQWWTVWTFNV